MFYNNKILFFIILFLMSTVLQYFVGQQVSLLPYIDNHFFLLIILLFMIITVSFLSAVCAFIVFYIFYKLISVLFKIKKDLNKCFCVWLFFTVFSYISIFFIFYKSISY